MSKLSAEQLKVANLTDDYIRDLEPENQRYDITLAGDFVISVLPNGIKTWAFIYDFQGRNRRKTLGVFPDMNFSEAKVALERARGAMVRMDEPTEPPEEFGRRPAVLGGSHYVPKSRRPRSYSKLLKILGVIAALTLLGAAAMWWQNRPPKTALTQPSSSAPARTPFAISLAAAADSTGRGDTPASTATDSFSAPGAAAATIAPDTNSTTAIEATSTNTSSTDASSIDNTPGNTLSAAIKPASESINYRKDKASNSTDSVATDTRKPLRSLPATTGATTIEPHSAPAKDATAYGGRVARSRITGEIVGLEPTDKLGPEISYKNSGFTRVFYYTELREFSDGNVVHRWELNGRIIDEVVLKVKKSWRWRTFSSKDLTPGLNGTWKISTIDATGTVLDTESFTYGAR